jgi:hypothetical protein
MSAVDPKKIRAVEEKSDIVMEDPKPKQITKFLNIGDRVSYIGNDDKYRSGGFVMTIAEDGSTFSISGGNLRWTVRTSNVAKIFIVSKE